MRAAEAIVPLATLLSSLLLCTALARRAWRLGMRLESLSAPLHELRGALTAIELGVAAIERSSEPRALDGCIDSLRFSVARAALGVQDIDAVQRGTQFAFDTRKQLDFSALVLRNARAWSRLASSYDASLDVDWRAGPVRVYGDAGRLQQALANLIVNALEHGGGSVLVEGELDRGFVRVIISDGGRGLPRRLDEILAQRRRSKHGYGLLVADAVLRNHHGSLSVGSGGNGSALVLQLPAAHSTERAPASARRAVAESVARAA
jgi:signal transduction histidine kinase